ncbi:hypothetical protein DMUE_0939 [Dictyocoela muelleri]|nr:hypothetical protein DMUE_0939 [Dictyocoela muelleri]
MPRKENERAQKKYTIRLNCTNNSILGYIPIEIFMNKSAFKNTNLQKKINISDIKNNQAKLCEIYNDNQQKLRKLVNYKIGDNVFILNMSPDKVEDKWLGPYEVIRVSQTGNNIYIDKNNKIMRISIKNCRPCGEGRM